MKQITKAFAAVETSTSTFKVGDKVIYYNSVFDGRITTMDKLYLTVTKVNKVNLIANDKTGNAYKIRMDDVNLISEFIFPLW